MTNNEVDWVDANKPQEGSKILVGLEYLPTPIKTHLRNNMSKRPSIKNVYHVTEILYCLRKAYWKRMGGKNDFDLAGLWNIYRGNTFDKKWSPLFEHNQVTFKSERKHPEFEDLITLTGTLDFIWVDESSLDKVLYDLKMPKNVFYKKQYGAGKFYKGQVQTYLAMAHENGEYTDVHRCRVLMLADDLVIEEVPERPEMLDIMWERTFLFHKSLKDKNPNILRGAEAEWECGERFCPGSVEWRLTCKQYPINEGFPTY